MYGSGFRVQCVGCRVQGVELRVQGSWLWVQGEMERGIEREGERYLNSHGNTGKEREKGTWIPMGAVKPYSSAFTMLRSLMSTRESSGMVQFSSISTRTVRPDTGTCAAWFRV